MIKRKAHLCLHFFTSILLASCAKQWIESPDFDSPSSWQPGYPPCARDEILFPESFQSAIVLPPEIETRAITFPADGAIIFRPDSTVSFSSGRSNGRQCKNSDGLAKIKAPAVRYWFDPHSWEENTDKEVISNLAVPHIERIPCNNEQVKISGTGPLSIDLSDMRTLRVGQVDLAGVNVSKEFMELLFKSELGEVMFKSASQTRVEYNNELECGCHRLDVYWDYEWAVCRHATCEKPKCMTAIVPTGHCCAICGAMIQIFVDKCEPYYRTELSKMIERSLKDQDMQDQLSYHISFVNAGVAKYLQAVFVENGDYQGSSNKFLQHFNKTAVWDVFNAKKKEFFTSGHPYNPNGLGAALLMMVGTLIGVLVFFIVIFVRFVPENRIIPLPRWMHVRWYDFFQSPFVFARFDNNAATEGEAAENVVIDVQQYNVSPELTRKMEGASTSFDNPMFVEKPPAKAALPKDNEDTDDDNIPSREESLTDIDLGTEIEGNL